MRIMCSTTVRWSVSSTPAAYGSSGEPGGAIRYGTTYIVLPADAPRIRSSSSGLHLRGRAPVVVDALVGRVARRDDRALLGAGGVLGVAARVVEPLARGQELAGVERLLDQPGVVGRR